jgi:uncharacterized protein
MHAALPDPPTLRQTPRRFGAWRTGAVRGLELAAQWMGGRTFYRRRHLRADRFLVRREELAPAELSPDLAGLCCVQLSDLHAGPFLRRGDLREVVAAVNRESPDLIFLTGDLITHDWRDALELVEDLSRLRARLGILGVFGNHDYRGRNEARIEQALAAGGVRFLRNACARFQVGEAWVGVVGLEDLEEGRQIDLDAARSELRPGDLELVLCHHPAGGPKMARAGCAAIFSGHTHGGQLDLPGLRAVGPAHPGARVRLGSTTLIVNRGLGTLGVPLRVGAPTEIVVARLTRKEP